DPADVGGELRDAAVGRSTVSDVGRSVYQPDAGTLRRVLRFTVGGTVVDNHHPDSTTGRFRQRVEELSQRLPRKVGHDHHGDVVAVTIGITGCAAALDTHLFTHPHHVVLICPGKPTHRHTHPGRGDDHPAPVRKPRDGVQH